jgi:hypothetical protein
MRFKAVAFENVFNERERNAVKESGSDKNLRESVALLLS